MGLGRLVVAVFRGRLFGVVGGLLESVSHMSGKWKMHKAAARSVALHLDQDATDWAAKLLEADEYVGSQKSRKKIEGLFGEAKGQMGLSRARLRGWAGVDEQCLMTAMAQDIKRIGVDAKVGCPKRPVR